MSLDPSGAQLPESSGLFLCSQRGFKFRAFLAEILLPITGYMLVHVAWKYDITRTIFDEPIDKTYTCDVCVWWEGCAPTREQPFQILRAFPSVGYFRMHAIFSILSAFRIL